MLVAHVAQAGGWYIDGGMHRLARGLADLAHPARIEVIALPQLVLDPQQTTQDPFAVDPCIADVNQRQAGLDGFLDGAQSKSDFLNHVYWVPLSWASSLTVKAFEQVSINQLITILSIAVQHLKYEPIGS